MSNMQTVLSSSKHNVTGQLLTVTLINRGQTETELRVGFLSSSRGSAYVWTLTTKEPK